MRVLAVHPGANVAVCDVYDGQTRALRALGVDVAEYRLDGRIDYADKFLTGLWDQAEPKPPQAPTWGDVLYLAGIHALERALRQRVDWVLCWSGLYLHPDALILMKRAGLRVGIIGTEAPYDVEQEARLAALADVFWTNERSSLPAFRAVNPNSHYLPAAYDPIRHSAFAGVEHLGEPSDVCFVGSGFPERVALLGGVDWAGLGADLALYGFWELPEGHPLRPFVRGEAIPNAQAVAQYRAAKITLNLYRQAAGPTPLEPDAPRVEYAESMNPRAYELAALGAFTLSDRRAEQDEILGDAVPTFATADELAALIQRFLPDPEARREHARRAREAIGPHTFEARASQLLADLARTDAQASPLAKGA